MYYNEPDYNYYAVIQGRNATVYWKTLLEAVIWKWFYNLFHRRKGYLITNIWKTKNYVLITDNDTRPERGHISKKQERKV